MNIADIQPPFWFADMKDTRLQLMIYGKEIKSAMVEVDYPNIDIEKIVRLDSPNYLFVYLNIANAKPGSLTLTFKQGTQTKKIVYELKAREKNGDERIGFTNADVLYMLMPDRFASGSKHSKLIDSLSPYTINRNEPSLRHGGDLEGIRQHLDYFSDLGVTTLWLTPVLENNSPDHGNQSTYHGYATTNYYRVDPRLGTNEEYRRLCDEAHNRGLKVVMDMIFNHCGFEHPWVGDMPSKDWINEAEWLLPENQAHTMVKNTMDGEIMVNDKYLQTSYKLTTVVDPYASEIDRHETMDGWFVPTMPDLNQRNPHLIKYLIQNSIWWIEAVGIDGIRMDTYPYADRKAMALWMKTLGKEYPHFNTVGETWVTEPAYTAAWQKDSKLSTENSYLPTVMDFAFFDRINAAKHEETDDWWQGFNRIYNCLCYDYLYEDPTHVMAFLDNHDTDRFLGNGKDSTALRQALALLLTINRIPQIYYGTEILMNGTKYATDGNVRKDFLGGFKGDKRNKFTKKGRNKAENEMFGWLSRILHWRQGNEVISKGKQTQFIPQNGVYVVARQYRGKTIMTILNGKRKANKLAIGRYAEIIGNANSATDITTGNTINLSSDINLKPRAVMILEF